MTDRADGKKGLSLYLTLLTGVFATIGALLIFLTLTTIPRVSELLEKNAVERTRETVLQSTKSLQIYIDGMFSTLHYVSGALPARPAEDDAYRLQIDLLQQSQRDIRTVAFFGEDGTLFYSTAGELSVSPQRVRAAEWFEKARLWEGTVCYFSAPHVQHIFAGRYDWVVSLAKAVEYLDDGQAKTGVLLMDYDFSPIASLLSDISLGSSGYIYLIDTADQLLYHPRQQLLYAGLDREDMTAVREQVVGVCRDVEDGRGRVLIIHPVAQARWRMVGVAYIDEITQLQSAFIRILTIALASGALLSLGIASIMAYYVIRPIHHLQGKMRQVEAGDLNTAITTRGFREIRSLSEAFNHMLQRIRGLMAQIVSEQEAKRLHELNALQAQINPHFLYNTLDSIIWMEERGRSKEAITMVSALAKLFRISISKGRNIISVREELAHVDNYMIIQKMRFRNKFTYEIQADPEALERRTVKLIVQPLVENAVHHAIDAYGEETLRITVHARLEGPLLLITVADDGAGIPEKKLSAILDAPSGKSGIGVHNVQERIRLTCGPEFGLSIDSAEGEGTTVTLRLPADLEG